MQMIFQITPPTMAAVVAGDDLLLLLLFSSEVQTAAVAEINSTARMIDWWPVFLLKALALVSMLYFLFECHSTCPWAPPWKPCLTPAAAACAAAFLKNTLSQDFSHSWLWQEDVKLTWLISDCDHSVTLCKTDLTPSLLSTLVVNSAWALDRDAPVAR